jgi:hypothetical protein
LRQRRLEIGQARRHVVEPFRGAGSNPVGPANARAHALDAEALHAPQHAPEAIGSCQYTHSHRETTLRADSLRAFCAAVERRSVPPIDARVYALLDRAYRSA